MNPMYNMANTSKYWFTIYHSYYKDEQVSNPTRTSICVENCLYFGYNLGNFSTAFLFACNGGACTIQSGLVTNKGEPPKTFLYISHPDQPLSLLLGSTLKNTSSNICMLGNLKYAIICKWSFSLATYQIQQDTNEKSKTSK